MIGLDWVSEYVGIPYAPCGRDRSGVDCFGLARMIWKEVAGISVAPFLEYARDEAPKTLGSIIEEQRDAANEWIEIQPGQERPLDGVLIRCHGVGMHLGVVAQRGEMVHAQKGIHSCIESYKGPRWGKRVIGFWRHRSLA